MDLVFLEEYLFNYHLLDLLQTVNPSGAIARQASIPDFSQEVGDLKPPPTAKNAGVLNSPRRQLLTHPVLQHSIKYYFLQ